MLGTFILSSNRHFSNLSPGGSRSRPASGTFDASDITSGALDREEEASSPRQASVTSGVSAGLSSVDSAIGPSPGDAEEEEGVREKPKESKDSR